MKTEAEIQEELDSLWEAQENNVAMGYRFSASLADRIESLEWVLNIKQND